MNTELTQRGNRLVEMVNWEDSTEASGDSNFPCPQCRSELPQGSCFCPQCGIQVKKGEPEVQLVGEAAALWDAPASADEPKRFTPQMAGAPKCRFCKGPLDLGGEFCEQCGAPVSEAAASGQSNHSGLAPTRLEEKAPRERPLTVAPQPPAEPRSEPPGKPADPAWTSPAPPPEPVPATPRPASGPNPGEQQTPEVRVAPTPKTEPSPSVSSRPEERASRMRPLTLAPQPPAEQPSAPPRKPAEPAWTLPPPAPATTPVITRPASSPNPGALQSPRLEIAPPPKTEPFPSVPPRPPEKAWRLPPLAVVPQPPAEQRSAPAAKPAESAWSLSVPPLVPHPTIPSQAVPPAFAAVEPLAEKVARLAGTSAPRWGETPPAPGLRLFVPAPIRLPEPVAAARPKPPGRHFSLILVGGMVGLLVALGAVAGGYLIHLKARSDRGDIATAPPASNPAPPAEIAASALPPADTPTVTPEAPQPKGESHVPAGRPHRAKAATAAAPVEASPVDNSKSAELLNLQNLAREAYAKGSYAEPADASAIYYSKQALALDPSNEYARGLLENSIKGGEYQVRQAIGDKDFAAARRITGALAQLLQDNAVAAGLKDEIAAAEKAEDESRRAQLLPAAVLSFRVYHLHSGKDPGEKGSSCRGTLSVVAGRLKYVGETGPDGQVHTFDFACAEVREIKKNFRVASRENGFHVRTASSNTNFAPEDGLISHIPALASACAK